MRRIIFYLSIIFITLFMAESSTLYAIGPLASNEKDKKKSARDIVIAPAASRLPEYEKLTYIVKWLGVSVGEITASVKGIKNINGRDAYVLEVTAKTNDFCSGIYKIDDRFVSYMDVEHHYTLRHEVYRREGRYKKDAVTDFDQEKHMAHFKHLLNNSKKDFGIPPEAQDTLSACYYFRMLPIEIGKRIKYEVCNNESNYSLFGVVENKGFIRIPKLGRKEAMYIQPYAKLGEEDVKKGKVSGYFSCDEKRTPLLAVVKAPMFTEVTASLDKVEYRQKSE